MNENNENEGHVLKILTALVSDILEIVVIEGCWVYYVCVCVCMYVCVGRFIKLRNPVFYLF